MEMATMYMIEYGLTEEEAIEAVQKDEAFNKG